MDGECVICSGQLSLPAWEPYVPSRATQVVHKGRQLLRPIALLPKDPQTCFASNRAEQDFDDQFWFTRIRSLTCKP